MDGDEHELIEVDMTVGGVRYLAQARDGTYPVGSIGTTLRVYAAVDGAERELLRFDDFESDPHYHSPASSHEVNSISADLGDPTAWIVQRCTADLAAELAIAGFGEVCTDLDMAAIAASGPDVFALMAVALPPGYGRVPGSGVRAVGS